MTPEERIAQLEALFSALRDSWRAKVGRMPRGHEARFREVIRRFGVHRAGRAVDTVASAGLRRTADRWRLFLALFGEAP